MKNTFKWKSHPLYPTWRNMIGRCCNKNHPKYKDYGGREIVVCEEWLYDFSVFIKDMGLKPTPSDKYSIDRINNMDGYYKSNCRWATRSEQQQNKRVQKNNKLGHRGVMIRGDKYIAEKYINGKRTHIGTFNSVHEAVEARRLADIGKITYRKKP